MNNNKFVVGVDGGGTGTTVSLYNAHDRSEPFTPIISGETGPITVHPSHMEWTTDQIEQQVRVLAQEANLELPAQALVAGLAGAGRGDVRDDVQRLLEITGIASNLTVVTDVRVAHYDAFDGTAGLLLVSGTGSIAYGQDEDGTTKRVGGWGPKLGDEGSGYDIALRGLRAIVRAADGRGNETRIRKAVLAKRDLDGVNDLVEWSRQADRKEIASCAEDVLRVAAQDDEVAKEISASAVDKLTTHVRVLRDRLGPWDEDPDVVFHGGVISPGQPLFDEVKEAVHALHCVPRDQSVNPPRGAAKMAFDMVEQT